MFSKKYLYFFHASENQWRKYSSSVRLREKGASFFVTYLIFCALFISLDICLMHVCVHVYVYSEKRKGIAGENVDEQFFLEGMVKGDTV